MVRNLWCIHIPLGTIGLLCSPTGTYDASLLSAGCKQGVTQTIVILLIRALSNSFLGALIRLFNT